MCNLYRITTSVEAMRRLFRVGTNADLSLFNEIYPKRDAPVIRADSRGERRMEVMRWGVPPPGNISQPVTNVRNLDSRFWKPTLTNPERRCLVPVSAFCEWTAESDLHTGRKRKVWFEMCDGEPFVFAGITRPAMDGELDRFAFLTCAPNTVVGAIHPKAMPVILHGAAKDAWLTGDAAEALAMPVADELMRVADV